MLPIIQSTQSELEEKMLSNQKSVEEQAFKMYKSEPDKLQRYLTDYSVSQGDNVYEQWRILGVQLITKFNDGYIQNGKGRPQEKGYSESWLRKVVKERPQQFKLLQIDSAMPESKLVD